MHQLQGHFQLFHACSSGSRDLECIVHATVQPCNIKYQRDSGCSIYVFSYILLQLYYVFHRRAWFTCSQYKCLYLNSALLYNVATAVHSWFIATVMQYKIILNFKFYIDCIRCHVNSACMLWRNINIKIISYKHYNIAIAIHVTACTVSLLSLNEIYQLNLSAHAIKNSIAIATCSRKIALPSMQ